MPRRPRTDLERLTRGSDSCATARDRLPATARSPGQRAAGAAAVAAQVAVGLRLLAPRQATLTEHRRDRAGGFTITTGDPVLDGTSRHGLAVQLGGPPFLSLISDSTSEHLAVDEPAGKCARLALTSPGRVRSAGRRRGPGRSPWRRSAASRPRPACTDARPARPRRRAARRRGRGGAEHARSMTNRSGRRVAESLATVERYWLRRSK